MGGKYRGGRNHGGGGGGRRSGGGGGQRGFPQAGRGPSLQQLTKAIRRAAQEDDLRAATDAYGQLRERALELDGLTLKQLVGVLMAHGHVQPCVDMLGEIAGARAHHLRAAGGQARMPLGLAQLPDLIANLPQNISAAAAAGLIDALARATDFGAPDASGGAECAASAFFRQRARWAAMQLADEALAAHAAVGASDPRALAWQGRCIYGCTLSAGDKPGELLVAGGEDGAAEVRRAISTGDSVALRPLLPGLAPAGPDEAGQFAPQAREQAALLSGGWVEAEVANVRPLIVKPSSAATAKWMGSLVRQGAGGEAGGLRWRVDKLANRVTLNRVISALCTIAGSDGAGGTDGGAGGGGAGGKRGADGGARQQQQQQQGSAKASSRPASAIIAALLTPAGSGARLAWPASGAHPFGDGVAGAGKRAPPAGVDSVAKACRLPFAPMPGGGYPDDEEGEAGAPPAPTGACSLAAAFGFGGMGGLPTPPFARASPSMRGAADAFSARLRPSVSDLNRSQAEAVLAACTRRLSLIQGPPGTGKTKVAVRALQAWSRAGAKCLAASDSNIAVDNLLAGLIGAGVRAVRLGRPEATRADLLRYSADEIGLQAGSSRQAQMDARMRAVRTAEVVCCTCVGAGAPLLERMRFECVLIDEACQATEPATLVPLSHGVQALVLVGDQCQLPPTITSQAAEADGMGLSLFERLLRAGVRPRLLDVQYRMHPAIAEFPSDAFYAGAVGSGVRARDRPPPAGFAWPRAEWPVAFVHARGGCESAEGASKSNLAEAEAVCRIAHELLSSGGLPADGLGIISPYNAQVALLRRTLRAALGERGRAVEINSVDGFQGREKEVILVSTVRANGSGAVGFLADWRRANVALTRARRGLIVVGDAPTLGAERRAWGPFLLWCSQHGLLVGHAPLAGRYEVSRMHALCKADALLRAGPAGEEEEGEEAAAAPVRVRAEREGGYGPHPLSVLPGRGDERGRGGGGDEEPQSKRKRSRWEDAQPQPAARAHGPQPALLPLAPAQPGPPGAEEERRLRVLALERLQAAGGGGPAQAW